MTITSVILTTKNRSREAFALSLKIRAWLEENGIRVDLPSKELESCSDQSRQRADLIIVLGGDGTILSQARTMLDMDIPFIGVNLGKVGFLAEISPVSWKEQLAEVLSGSSHVSERVVLGYELISDDKVAARGCAINEIVVNRGEMARLICVELDLPGKVRQSIRSDGMIFSTPTGSTAYSVSAGGPLVHPDLDAMIITPICPFLHDFKPVVLPCSEPVLTWVSGAEADAYVTVDGQAGFRFKQGDRLRISRYNKDFKLLSYSGHTFMSKLVAKRFIKRR
ncbi:NAD(+)/NADH kinase [Desulfonatronovibrio hydrogenovorans]|uniref:NAD(+)/NADH kinase n=1 Tax=Desulfonatronovibrio hydrogenovorans TaxID=53245 RepID=UPI00068F7A89|nr:NAD(+)/NADH kinase [Desulfonatronovibrio hydrogenovorans]